MRLLRGVAVSAGRWMFLGSGGPSTWWAGVVLSGRLPGTYSFFWLGLGRRRGQPAEEWIPKGLQMAKVRGGGKSAVPPVFSLRASPLTGCILLARAQRFECTHAHAQ